MRVQFKTEGGIAYFPGLSKAVTMDSQKLSPAEGAQLEQVVNAAHFFDLPSQVGIPPRGAADYRQYLVTVEEGSRRHTVRFIEPLENPDLQALIDYLRTQAKARRA